MNKSDTKTPLIATTLILMVYFAGFLAFRISIHGWHLGPEYYATSPTAGKPVLQKVSGVTYGLQPQNKLKVFAYYLYWPLLLLDKKINHVGWKINDGKSIRRANWIYRF